MLAISAIIAIVLLSRLLMSWDLSKPIVADLRQALFWLSCRTKTVVSTITATKEESPKHV